jgi:hypothetical protein
MAAQDREAPVGFLSIRLERTELGFVATITANPDIADRLGDRVIRLTDPRTIPAYAEDFIATWLSGVDPAMHSTP